MRAGAWSPGRALNKPEDAITAAMEWAEKTGIADCATETWQKAFATFIGIVTPAQAAEFKAETSETGGESGNV